MCYFKSRLIFYLIFGLSCKILNSPAIKFKSRKKQRFCIHSRNGEIFSVMHDKRCFYAFFEYPFFRIQFIIYQWNIRFLNDENEFMFTLLALLLLIRWEWNGVSFNFSNVTGFGESKAFWIILCIFLDQILYTCAVYFKMRINLFESSSTW